MQFPRRKKLESLNSIAAPGHSLALERLEGRELLSSAVTRLMLVNADTDRDLFALGDGMVLNLATLPTRNLTVRADVGGGKTRSVRFSLDQAVNYVIENYAPYAIAGDARGGRDLLPWKAPLGPHTLTATPFLYDKARGAAGKSLTVRFQLIDASAPTAPTDLRTGEVSASHVQLNWADVTGETGYVVKRSTDGVNFETIATVTANASSWLDASVVAGTTYHYQVSSFNEAGHSASAALVSATTSVQLLPPAGVSDFVAMSHSSSEVNLFWTDLAEDESGYRVFRSDNGLSFEELAVLPPDTQSYSDTDVAKGVRYWYRVAAFNPGGESTLSDVDDAIPAAAIKPRTDGGTIPGVAGVLQGPPQTAVDFAKQQPLIRYNRNIAGGADTNQPGTGESAVTLALASFTGNSTADSRLIQQMLYTINDPSVTTGFNDFSSNGGYPAQHERHLQTAFTLAKLTPRIWNSLTDVQRKKIDLLMKATLVASAFTTSDNNPYVKAGTQQRAGLDADTNMNRGWNPNYREGMIGAILVNVVYFGGPENISKILETYDHQRFTAELKEYGLMNSHETFNWKNANPASIAPDGPTIEIAIKDYRYLGHGLTDYLGIYDAVTRVTFEKTVQCGVNNGQGVDTDNDGVGDAGKIVSGCETLPNFGGTGMLGEFDSIDANGPRSSAQYSYDGWRINLKNHLVLVAGGYWQPQTTVAVQALSRMSVGSIDLWYKLEHGYVNYQKGSAKTVQYSTNPNFNFELTGPLWSVVKAYHGIV